MKKTAQLLDVFKKRFSSAIAERKISPFTLRLRKRPSHMRLYEAACRAGELEIIGGDDLDLSYGLAQALVGLLSGHREEFLGSHRPHLSRRVLWMRGNTMCQIVPGLTTAVPQALVGPKGAETIARWASRIVEFGFNTIIFGGGSLVPENPTSTAALANILSLFKDYGLTVGLRISLSGRPSDSRCPFDPDYRQKIAEAFKGMVSEGVSPDLILWESQLLHPSFLSHSQASDALLFEVAQAEVHLLEQVLPTSTTLIFYLPVGGRDFVEQHTHGILSLCDTVGESTIIAFPAVAGEPERDHLPEHPVWDALRRYGEPSATPLLPVVNVGAVGQGDGLWPALTCEVLERYSDHQFRAPFAGIMALVDEIPQGNGFLACNLWVAGQVLWHQRPPARLIETWFDAYRPDLQYRSHIQALKLAREVVLDLSHLADIKASLSRPTQAALSPAHIDLLAARLRLLDQLFRFDSEVSQGLNSSMADYFHYFSRDAWCLLHWHLDRLRLPAPGVAAAVDHSGGFWTSIKAQGGRNVPGGATVTCLDSPRWISEDARMGLVFHENRAEK